MPKKPSFSWPLVPDNASETPRMLTDAELAEVNTIFVPVEEMIAQSIEDCTAYPFDTVLEALARLQDYYDGMQRDIDVQLDAEIAAEEADA